MLPGFRVLFATILLSVSLLVFGLGAAALLRAAHDNFAGLAAPPPTSEAQVAREREQRQATLALLRVEMQAQPAQHPDLPAGPPAAETAVSASPAAQAPAVTEAKPAEPAAEVKVEARTDATPAPEQKSEATVTAATEPKLDTNSETKPEAKTEAKTEPKPEAGAEAAPAAAAPIVIALAPAVPDPAPVATAPAPTGGSQASRDDQGVDAVAAPPPPASGENAEPSTAKPVETAALDAPALADLPEDVVKAAARPRPEIPRHVARRHKKPKVHHVRTAERARPAAQQIRPLQQQPQRTQQPTLFPGFGG